MQDELRASDLRARQLTSNLTRLWTDETTTDTVFIVGGERICVHSAISMFLRKKKKKMNQRKTNLSLKYPTGVYHWTGCCSQ